MHVEWRTTGAETRQRAHSLPGGGIRGLVAACGCEALVRQTRLHPWQSPKHISLSTCDNQPCPLRARQGFDTSVSNPLVANEAIVVIIYFMCQPLP